MCYEDVSEFVWQTGTVMGKVWHPKLVEGLETTIYALSLLKDNHTQMSKNTPGNL